MSGLLLSHVRGGADAGDLNTAHSHANGQGCPQYISTYLQTGVFSIGFPAAHSTHESCHRLVAGIEQDADDLRPRGFLPVFPPYPCRYSYYHRHQTPGNTTVPAPKVGVIVTL